MRDRFRQQFYPVIDFSRIQVKLNKKRNQMNTDLLREYYPDGAPIIIQVAFKYGYGPAIIELNQKVYFNEDLSFPPLIREAIQGVCLSSCKNQYCAVMHARGLITEGFTIADVKQLVDLQRLPDWVPEKEKWEDSLRRIAVIFRESGVASLVYKSLHTINIADEINDIGGAIAFSLLHKFLLEFYDDEIDVNEEPILFQTVECGQELITYFSDAYEKNTPTFIICCICKDLKGEHDWLPIERMLSEIPSNAKFSHGICNRCLKQSYSEFF